MPKQFAPNLNLNSVKASLACEPVDFLPANCMARQQALLQKVGEHIAEPQAGAPQGIGGDALDAKREEFYGEHHQHNQRRT